VSARLGLAPIALAVATLALAAPPAGASFGFKPGAEGLSVVPSQEGGTPATRAGSHPQTLRTEINFNLGPESPGQPGVPFSDGDLKDLEIDLPPGLIENPSAVPQCPLAAFHTPRQSPFEASLSGESCSDRSQIGTVEVRSSFGGGITRTFGVFNLDPPPGAPSEFGFNPYGAPITFVPHVRQADGEYGLALVARNISQLIDFSGFTLNIWGAPWNVGHNAQRGNCLNEAEPSFGWAKCSVGPPELDANRPLAYLTLPTACEAPLTFTVSTTSWQGPTAPVTRSVAGQSLEDCDELEFQPFPRAGVSDPRASSPSGYDFELDVLNGGFLDPTRRAPSPVEKAAVRLPEGMTINPSVGAGLGVCSPAQYAAETVVSPPGAGCPNAAKIGDFTVRSPLFEKTVEGALFLAAPRDNPFGTLLGVYMVAKNPERGILVKVAGRLDADPTSGRLTATFDNLPQLPYTDLRVHFREGQRSPLATPAACGSFFTEADLSPWRSPGTVRRSALPLTIGAGVGGGPCPSGTPPFKPGAQAGALNSNAGSYTPFYLHLTRGDTEQEITSYSAKLPPGLTGKIGAIPYCPEAAIAAAKRRGGFEEAAHPSCPAASEIGHTVAGYGLGPALTFAPGGLYLAGPFHGSTFSVVAIDSAIVGPFDLGVIVVRSAIKVDPQSAQVTIDSAGSDPIPHIVDGIPIHLRDVRVYISRPNLTLNPTSCERFSVASTLNGSGNRFGDPSDDTTATATSPFQAFNCAELGFRPRLSLRLKGGAKRGDYPSLRAEVRPRPGDANIASASVALPPSEFLAQEHIDTICTRGQFAREACPGQSVYGHARAFTPLLDQPLEGNVYLRSSDNPLPDLVAALRGGGKGIAIDVVGRIDSVKGGLRGTFDALPDAPVSKFVMKLRGGKRGLLVNAENVCAAPQLGSARFVGKNNLGERLRPRLAYQCGKRSGRRPKHRGHPAKGGKR
jgi:hypothetical protein